MMTKCFCWIVIIIYSFTSWNKFQLEYATKLLDEGASIRFEVSNLSDDIKRIYDIEIKKRVNGRTEITNLELKNWSNFYPETIKNQFVKDLQNIEKLDELKWVFNTTSGVNKSNLKEKIINTLKKADGTPNEELEMIKLEQVKKLFPKEARIITNKNRLDFLLKKLEEDKIFNQIFEIVE